MMHPGCRDVPGVLVHSLRYNFIALLAALGVCALTAAAAVAQQSSDDQPSGGDVDPPTRAARLSYAEGAVSMQPAGVEDWSAATVNRPLTNGDQLWSDRGSRAEIEFGSATVFLGDSSSVSLLNFTDQTVQLQVSAGVVNIALRDLDRSGSFEIDAPNATVSLVRPGSYRLGVDSAGNTTVAMRDGQAQVITNTGESIILRGGQGAQFGPDGAVDVAPLAAADDFDRWCAQRQQRLAHSQYAAQYVSSDVVGAEDLDDSGEWSQEPDYGYVWYPTQVAADWAPYRYGRWLWVTPWGWTWVDSAPWGYAPFHYGRWAYLRQRWAWVPGPPHARAVYAPALVAWIGAGAVGVAVTAGPGVGWLPLAPGEVYLPGYRVSPRYLQNVNVSNTIIVNNTYITNVYQNPALQNRYANRESPRALTVVSQSSFASGQSVAGRVIEPPPQWRAGPATSQPPAILPARQSVLGPAASTPVKRPSIAILNRPVVARHQPPPAPAPFERQIDAMRSNGGRALPPAQLQHLPAAGPARANVVLAPPPRYVPAAPVTPAAPATGTRATPGRPLTPERGAVPVTPAAPAAPPSSLPNDRRTIPERSPQFQQPVQVQQPAQSRGQGREQPPQTVTAPQPQPRAAAPTPTPTPTPPPPPKAAPPPRQPAPPAQSQSKPAPQAARPDDHPVKPP